MNNLKYQDLVLYWKINYLQPTFQRRIKFVSTLFTNVNVEIKLVLR